jgi:hypothetical protein
MNNDELKLLSNGIASIADALDIHFEEVMEALAEGDVLTCRDLDQLLDYRETL